MSRMGSKNLMQGEEEIKGISRVNVTLALNQVVIKRKGKKKRKIERANWKLKGKKGTLVGRKGLRFLLIVKGRKGGEGRVG